MIFQNTLDVELALGALWTSNNMQHAFGVFSQHQLRTSKMNYEVWNLQIHARKGKAFKQASKALEFS